MALPTGNGMNDATPEPRTPVMIMVEASWKDQGGAIQCTRARIENKSSGGACIRLDRKIPVGTKLTVEGQWERFSGEARYCRQDGRDYLVGIQKDKTEWPPTTRLAGKLEAPKEKGVLPDVEALMGRMQERGPCKSVEVPASNETLEGVLKTNRSEQTFAATSERETGRELRNGERRRTVQDKRLEGLERTEEQRQPSAEWEAGRERKHMRRKWFDMGHKEEIQEGSNEILHHNEETPNRTPTASAPPERFAGADEAEPGTQLELLSMEDIYRVAGIVSPRKGYSIEKIVEMLHSEHLRGLSKEMKRASVLMALDAAGVSVDEVLQDAKARQDAIDSYEAEQRKQFEAQLARKSEENVQIQAEMERVKARYTERLRRNLDGMAREKATFGNWLTMKQQEAQSMAEAVDLCLKPAAPEKPSTPLEDVSLAGARVKPV
jgi:hypothetical protein